MIRLQGAEENGTIVSEETEPNVKRMKTSVCIACLGIFQNDTIDAAIKEIVENTDLHTYECDSIYTSISVPILVQIRELALWIALLRKFPYSISDSEFDRIYVWFRNERFEFFVSLSSSFSVNLFHSHRTAQPPNMSIKEIFKYLMNNRLCVKTNRTLEQNQDGILVNVFFEHENENDELERLKLIYPKSLDKTFNNKK